MITPDRESAGIRVAFWVVNALTGTVESPLDLAEATLSVSDDGGTMSGTLDLNAGLQRRSERIIPDYREIRRRIGLMAPGRHSIVATDNRRRVIGEWVIGGLGRTTNATSMKISGFAWEQYPKYRALESTRKHQSIDSLTLLRALLGEVYAGVTYTPAGPTVSGVAIGMDRAANAGYYSDAVREITDGDPPLEWVMEIDGVWSGEALTSVARTLRYGSPKITRSTGLSFVAGESMTRQGNCQLAGGSDYSLYAHKIIGLGSGSGSKQLVVSASDPSPPAGVIRSTRLLQAGEVASQAALNRLARQALSDGLTMREPWKATEVQIGALPKLPQPYDQARIYHDRSYSYPSPGGGVPAIDEVLRVGEVTYRVSGSACELVEVDLG